jgi:pSer/pThr/pTyr-binding forkhead associated (FHA) protein
MTERTTGAMHQVDIPPRPGSATGRNTAGLVLLYADEYQKLPAAWPLRQERLTIGRDPTADICLPISAVSRMHAEV